MKRIISTIVLAAAVFSFAADTSGPVADFLLIGSGCRAYYVAEALAAEDSYIGALNYNPAGGYRLRTVNVLVSHAWWFRNSDFDGFLYEYASVLFPLGSAPEKGNLGVSVKMFRSPEFEFIDYNGDFQEMINAGDMALNLTYNRPIGDMFGAGITAKYIQSRLADYTASGFAFDAGAQASLGGGERPVKLGLALRNIGPALKYSKTAEILPADLSVGIQNMILHNPDKNLDINLMGAYQLTAGASSLNTGTEFVVDNNIFFGTGVKFFHDTQKFNIGFGFKIRMGNAATRVYYTLVTGKPVAPTHMLSLVFHQGSQD